jgi:DNA-binding transcriptional regulator YiaG
MPASGVPYTMRVADGATLFVEVPARMAEVDRGGQVAFTPQGVRFLDRVRALASRIPSPPSPAFLATLREALGMTQEQLGKAIGRDKLTVSRWERGTLRPNPEALARLDALARKRKRSGIRLPG